MTRSRRETAAVLGDSESARIQAQNLASVSLKPRCPISFSSPLVPRFGKNVVRSVRGPEADWRRGALRGNLRAVGDIPRRRFTPGPTHSEAMMDELTGALVEIWDRLELQAVKAA